MRILSYGYRDIEENGWRFDILNLQSVNLFVGASGSGKTRLLNTIVNICESMTKSQRCYPGIWEMTILCHGKRYKWLYHAKSNVDAGENGIVEERVTQIEENGTECVLVDRNPERFIFNDQTIPKLSMQSSAISLLKEEELIKPLYEGFMAVQRRRFFSNDLEQAASYQTIPKLLRRKSKKIGREDIGVDQSNLSLNVKLYLLQQSNPNVYKSICNAFKEVFPSVDSCEIKDLSQFNDVVVSVDLANGSVPVFCIREKAVKNLIRLPELSSGMIKVLLIITDIVSLPDESLYILDEYENSLGVNAIGFLPDLLDQHSERLQFIITSHHPYLINAIPISNWFILHREGSSVRIQYGERVKEKFGKSHQESFVQLLNDPFYNQGTL